MTAEVGKHLHEFFQFGPGRCAFGYVPWEKGLVGLAAEASATRVAPLVPHVLGKAAGEQVARAPSASDRLDDVRLR